MTASSPNRAAADFELDLMHPIGSNAKLALSRHALFLAASARITLHENSGRTAGGLMELSVQLLESHQVPVLGLKMSP